MSTIKELELAKAIEKLKPPNLLSPMWSDWCAVVALTQQHAAEVAELEAERDKAKEVIVKILTVAKKTPVGYLIHKDDWNSIAELGEK